MNVHGKRPVFVQVTRIALGESYGYQRALFSLHINKSLK
ncbi:hypothetical protein Z946_2547 [Sulfitobacter noctilucicola]|nr:hypothetical protein Z946_2547 [Sulfitobacter noctilucicola]